MKVVLAEHAGFCFGVKRAVEMTEDLAKEGGSSYTLGPIVHNEEVVSDFEKKGVRSISFEEAMDLPPSKIIIRAHGISEKKEDALKEKGHTLIDATCPLVKKLHDTADEFSRKNYFILIIGDATHPEIEGIVGHISGDDYAVIKTEEEAKDFNMKKDMPICIISQTTFNYKKFKELVEIIVKKGYDVNTLGGICNATMTRQKEAEQIASEVDAMIVIGGRDSSNSRKLFDIAKGKCKSFFVQTKSDLNLSELYSIETVGITAGASTPDNIIREVMNECQK